ncbi:hypothetical protein [Nocardiopsis aegyptia]|uniref:Uncharacterized protein n=1 Tax=Nocardiopsis aegyptia TaxID=220378 RepID=A0A7Z0JB37_9ACTN|nr:hypothetical protein [Nocardiopsis aegyptia]NYJ35928.1 hypothetical protein [Nocardiopsis aegyptia]
MRVFIEGRGWKRNQVAKEMPRVVDRYLEVHPVPKGEKKPLEIIVGSTLSRWVNKGHSKPAPRATFNAIVLTVLHLEWEASGKPGTPPDLRDVARHWNEWHSRLKTTSGSPIPSSETARPPAETIVQIDLSDAVHVRLSKAYGSAGASLLQATRDSDVSAALDLGLLRFLDGHRAEGESFLQQAQTGGSREAAALLDSEDPSEVRAATAARLAFDRAVRLDGDSHNGERKVLLLERAAHAKIRSAIGMLADHFESLGETGSAARWRLLADQER